MIFGNLILIAIPPVTAAAGALCARKEQRALFCLICGALVYLVSAYGALNGTLTGLAAIMSERPPISSLGGINAPPAYALIVRICAETGTGGQGFITVQAFLQGFLTAAYLYNRPDIPYAGAAVLTAAFLPVVCCDANVFTAVVICLFSAKYIEERRFFRFAAVIFAAACFDISVLLLIPVWFLSFIPKNLVTALLTAGIACAAVMLPGVCGAVYGFLGEGLYGKPANPALPAVCACVAALLLMLTAAMYRTRNENTARLIPVFTAGAALSAAAVFEPRLTVVSQAALALSAAVIAPDALAIFRRFAEIMLPGHEKAAGRTAAVILVLLVMALGAYIVLSDCFGTSRFAAGLFGEAVDL